MGRPRLLKVGFVVSELVSLCQKHEYQGYVPECACELCALRAMVKTRVQARNCVTIEIAAIKELSKAWEIDPHGSPFIRMLQEIEQMAEDAAPPNVHMRRVFVGCTQLSTRANCSQCKQETEYTIECARCGEEVCESCIEKGKCDE